MAEPKRRRGHTRISRKNQVTIPVSVLAATRLGPGQELRVEAAETGAIVLTPVTGRGARRRAAIARTAGSLPGVYEPGDLERLRDEWRSS